MAEISLSLATRMVIIFIAIRKPYCRRGAFLMQMRDLVIENISDAEALLQALMSDENAGFDIKGIVFKEWASTHVYLKDTGTSSAIRAPFMDAFVSIQKQIYQLGAYAKTGSSDVKQLSDLDRQELEIVVYVSGGSDDYKVSTAKALERCFKAMLGKLSGREAAIVILGLAVLLAATWGWSAWLQQQKEIKLDEIKSKEHIEAIQSLSFANKQQVEVFQSLISVLEKQGEAGARAISSAQASYESLLKAASKTPSTEVNGTVIGAAQADTLRISARKQAQPRFVIQKMRVIDINTSNDSDVMVLLDKSTNEQHKTKLPNTLFRASDRDHLFVALKTREDIWIELVLKEVDGEVRSVEFLRVAEDPTKQKK